MARKSKAVNGRPKDVRHDFSSLAKIVEHQARLNPDRVALIMLPDGDTEVGMITYRELDQRARAFAARLQHEGLSGECILLLLPSSIYYVVAFIGCLYAGAIPVPGYPPTNSMHAERIAHIAADCRARGAIVASANSLDALRSKLGKLFAEGLDCLLIPVDGMNGISEADWVEPQQHTNAIAYLQYTSGSTSNPRGVVITHANLLSYCRNRHESLAITQDDVFVTWLPLFHDMGLIAGVLQALYAGATIVMMPPLAFLQKPLRWLSAISKYRGSISYAPNFAYELCAASLDQASINTLDLSSWSLAGNAAEAVHADTLTNFVNRFEPCGFKAAAMNPSYGLAEATLVITYHRRLMPAPVIKVDAESLGQGKFTAPRIGERVARLVSCGGQGADTQVICVNPDAHTPCSDGDVGEIWVRGSVVSPGYWQRPEETEKTFAAFLSDGQGPFLRTGDLGAWSNGHLYITGRIKDVIIIRGQNHYPQDIEQTACRAHPSLAIGHGAAFSVEVGNEERLVVAQEVRRSQRSRIDGAEVVQAIRSAIAEVHGLPVYAVLLLKPASVHITSSGKIQRRACKQSFLNNQFEALYAWREDDVPVAVSTRPYQAVVAWMTENIARLQNIPANRVLSDMPFAGFGLDSLKLVALTGELAAWLKVPIEPTLLYNYPNIDCAARYLSGQRADEPQAEHDGVKQSEPIAIVGIACRLPKANSVDEYWQLLDAGIDAITEVPASRWDRDAYYQPGPAVPGKAYTKWGGFVDGVEDFDSHFFGIAPREANGMDPQQRILLQTTWHALEDAGIPPDSLAGTDTGVFVGAMTHDYELAWLHRNAPLDGFFGTGTHASIIANRISYLFDLRGPSCVVETACSSSMVALHHARASLLQRESGVAVVGGVNLILSPELMVALSHAQMLSPDGRCMAFDARANGYVRSEGCAVLILKRYCDAVRDNNRIHGLIAGSALNQDGKSNGMTAPNAQAQEAVIRKALAAADLAPGSVSYVEAHGTGTSLGDPIEMDALKKTYGAASERHPTLWVGAAKSNIGHTEPVSGLAGLIKVLLAMRHERIPRNLHIQQLNSRLHLEQSRCAVVAEAQAWKRGETPRFAGISSFGFGGANAHVIVQEPPMVETAQEDDTVELLTLSAKTSRALLQVARDFAAFLDASKAGQQPALRALCHTANAYRSHLTCRAAVVGRTRQELADELRKFVADEKAYDLKSDGADAKADGKTAYLFTGQGAQYRGMGKDLYLGHATFRQTMERCDRILRPLLNVSLIEALYGEDETACDLNQTMYAQPALFAVEYALAGVWQSCGIAPDYLIGHSLGEYVAACIAGVFSLEDALKLVAHRGRLMQTDTEAGAMTAIHAPQESIACLLKEFEAQAHPGASVASYNTAEDIVISGTAEAVGTLAKKWMAEHDVLAAPLHVMRGFHSPLMHGMLAEFERVAREVRYNKPTIPVISNVTGSVIDVELTDPRYWVEHIVKPVAFLQGVQCLQQLGCATFVEIGPHPVLTSFGKQILGQGTWLPSLRRGVDDMTHLLSSIARGYVHGERIDWTRWARERQGVTTALPQPVSLPCYPFEKERHWLAPPVAQPARRNREAMLHPLLGSRIELPRPGLHCFDNQLSAGHPWFIGQHRIFDVPVLPLAGMIETLLAAARAVAPSPVPEWTIEGLALKAPLVFEDGTSADYRTVLEEDGRSYRIDLEGRYQHTAESKWQEFASARVHPSYTSAAAQSLDVAALQARLTVEPVEGKYERWRNIGLAYGPGFQCVKELWHSGNEGLAYVDMQEPAVAEADKYYLHPAMLDACLHVSIPFVEHLLAGMQLALLPVGFERMMVCRRLPRRVWAHGTWHGEQPGGRYACSLALFDEAGEPVLSISGLQFGLANPNSVTANGQSQPALSYYATRWLPFERPMAAPAEAGRHWMVMCRDAQAADDLRLQFENHGIAATTVTRGHALDWMSENVAALDWNEETQWERLFASLRSRNVHPDGLLLYTGDQTAGLPEHMVDRTYELSQSGFFALKHFLSAYGDANPQVVICTRGAYAPHPAVEDGERMREAGLMQAVLNGLTKSVVMEFSHVKCVQFDLDPASCAVPLPTVLASASQAEGSIELAMRGERIFQARLGEQRRVDLQNRAPAIRSDAAYLVTGGLRGLGLATAQWLVGQGVRYLALAGRAIYPESRAAIDAMESSGVTVSILRVDVSDTAALEHAFKRLTSGMPPLRGVIHSAGLTDDAMLTGMSWPTFRNVLDPKIKGAWNLHVLTENMDLDFFVLFSSAASLFGAAVGQANYIAACAFLDSLAQYRRQRGLSAMSLNWGYWSETGIAMRRDLNRQMALKGVHGIDTQPGMAALGRAIAANPAQCGPIRIDWARFKSVMCPGVSYQLLTDLGNGEEAQRPPEEDAIPLSQEALAEMPMDDAKGLLLAYLMRRVARVLGLSAQRRTEIEPLFGGMKLNRLGFDSLMALEMRHQIRKDWGVGVPLRDFLAGSTAAEVAALIYQQLVVRKLNAAEPAQASDEKFEEILL